MDCNFVCLFCEASYNTDKHECAYCLPLERGVAHLDVCQMCRRLLNIFHARQLGYKRRLRLENDDGA